MPICYSLDTYSVQRRVQEVGFEQAAVDFNLGADAQFEVGAAMGEYEEK